MSLRALRSALIALLLAAVAYETAHSAPVQDLSPISHVIHGEPVTSHAEYPFVVDLSQSPDDISTTRFCTGTLIRPNIVLTAAHCILNTGMVGEGTFATIGRINVKDGHAANKDTETFRALDSIAHPDYRGLGSPNDVGVLLLDGQSSKKTVKLANATPSHGTEVSVVGYGIKWIGTLEQTHRHIEILPHKLQKTKLRIRERSFCDEEGAPETSEGMLCTSGVARGSSACKGDSGGGLFLDENGSKVQVGIVSYGDSDCVSRESGVFTDVAAVDDWIAGAAKQLSEIENEQVSLEVPQSGRYLHTGRVKTPSTRASLKLFRLRSNNLEFSSRVVVNVCTRKSEGIPRLQLIGTEGKNPIEGPAEDCHKGEVGLRLSYKARNGHSELIALSGASADDEYRMTLSSSGAAKRVSFL